MVHVLFARDLLFIDPDDAKPLEELCKFYQNEVNCVYKGTILTDIFKGENNFAKFRRKEIYTKVTIFATSKVNRQ